jgi:hypothetical protein
MGNKQEKEINSLYNETITLFEFIKASGNIIELKEKCSVLRANLYCLITMLDNFSDLGTENKIAEVHYKVIDMLFTLRKKELAIDNLQMNDIDIMNRTLSLVANHRLDNIYSKLNNITHILSDIQEDGNVASILGSVVSIFNIYNVVDRMRSNNTSLLISNSILNKQYHMDDNSDIEDNKSNINELEGDGEIQNNKEPENKDKPYKKKHISATLKRLVWNKYIGESIGKAKCYCCKTTDITQLSFHCGHVIPEYEGGYTTLDNLRPICQNCNSSMGTQNMNEFMKQFNE